MVAHALLLQASPIDTDRMVTVWLDEGGAVIVTGSRL
jgi:hypothetical protein